MNALGVQLAEARASLTKADEERGTLTARFESFQKSLQSGDVPFEQRKDVEAMLGGLKQEVARTEALRQRLQAQAAELSGQLTTEQGRWVYFNDSLDQIEQSLQQLQQAR